MTKSSFKLIYLILGYIENSFLIIDNNNGLCHDTYLMKLFDVMDEEEDKEGAIIIEIYNKIETEANICFCFYQ